MNTDIIKNLLIFMERVTVTGKESVAWCEAYAYLQNQLTPVTPTPAVEG